VTRDIFLREQIARNQRRAYSTHTQQPEPWELSSEGKSVVLGVGNPYMHDDAVGLEVVAEFRKLPFSEDVIAFECRSLDLSLLTYFRNSSRIVFIDAFSSGEAPGTVSKYLVKDLKESALKVPNLHDLQLYDIVDVANRKGVLSCPIVIVGIEPKDCSPGEGLSEEARAAIPKAIKVIKELVGSGA
jgi:hydrogenase maturation protease